MANDRRWLRVDPRSEEGQVSEKNILSSDFALIHEKSADETGVGSTVVRYVLKGLWQDTLSHRGSDYSSFDMLDSGHMQEAGAPQIPQEGLYVAIPENATFKELKVLDVTEEELDEKHNFLPAPKPVFEGEEVEYEPLPEIYESDERFPGKHAEYLATRHVSGHQVVHIMIYLAQYTPKSQRVLVLKSLEFEVLYETTPGQGTDSKASKRLRKAFGPLILGAHDTEHSHGDAASSAQPSADDAPDRSLRDHDNAADFLIITVQDLILSLAIFEAVKTYKHQVMIVTKEQIISEFPAAEVDISIRDFLVYATQHWSVPPETVVLGGDVSVIPTHIRTHMGEDIASDQFYADLTGDMLPDTSLSRIPAATSGDMTALCDMLSYYNRYHGGWRENVLLTTFNRDDYNQCKDQIADDIGGAFNVLKRYDGQATKAEVIDTINSGVVFANYRGHGSSTGWSAGNGLHCGDIPGLANGDKTPQVLSIACLNNDIDHSETHGGPCFGEKWLLEEKAVAFLGASRPSYTHINHAFDKYLWNGIVQQGLTTAGDIFDWGTTQLYLNNPGEHTKHNIYMYLLLGDPTADYEEKIVPTQTKVGFVLMLDNSGSMREAMPMVKIDGKAFVREARPGDQLGVNNFNQNASWLYPTGGSPSIATVDGSLVQTKEAAAAIEALAASYKTTNLGHAIELGNDMIGQATTDVKAFVILSDGIWNTGPDPTSVLGAEPPIFVAGLGPHLSKEMYEPLLAKNVNSKFYHKPNAWEMMQIFNDIRALPQDVALTANALGHYDGSDYTLTQSVISADSEEAQFVVVWTDKRFKYTSGDPGGFAINVVLIDPTGKTSGIKPVIVDDGYCIFNLENVQPGTWHTLVQYSVPMSIYGTSGGFQFDTVVNLEVDGPSYHPIGEPLTFRARMIDEGSPIEGLTVHARITKPVISIDGALRKYHERLKSVQPARQLEGAEIPEEHARLLTLRDSLMEEGDILGTKSSHQLMTSTPEGDYECTLSDLEEAGAYSIEVQVTGANSATGRAFSRTANLSTLVG